MPFAVVVGDRERSEQILSVRGRDGRWTAPVEDAVADLVRRCAVPGGPPGDAAS